MLAATTLAYLAGLIDGEGSLTASPVTTRGRRYFWLGLRITTTDRGLADWLRDTFGGTVNGYQPLGGRRFAYNWLVSGKCAAELLELALPYLRVKRVQTTFWLAFWRLPPEKRRDAEQLRLQMRAAA